MVVVHLPGVWDDRYSVRLSESGNLARLSDSAHAIGIKLNVIQRTSLQQISESKQGEFVLASSNRDAAVRLQLSIALDVVRDDRLFQPAKLKRLQQRKHSLRVIERPPHIGVSHYINVVAHRLSHRANQLDVALHARSPIHGPPPETKLHRFKSIIFVALRLGSQLP